MEENVNKYKGFTHPKEQVMYDGWDVKYQGYDYSKTLIKNSLSKYLYANNKLAGFLDHLNDFMVNLVESVKYIRNYYNYAVPKNYRKIN
jgi:hypothetical protein